MPEPIFNRILLKLSGEALAANQGFGVESARIHEIAGELADVQSLGVQIAIVVGDQKSGGDQPHCRAFEINWPVGRLQQTDGDNARRMPVAFCRWKSRRNPLPSLYFYQTLRLRQSQMSGQADCRLPN